jgi:curved DNA-binding protein CbpA
MVAESNTFDHTSSPRPAQSILQKSKIRNNKPAVAMITPDRNSSGDGGGGTGNGTGTGTDIGGGSTSISTASSLHESSSIPDLYIQTIVSGFGEDADLYKDVLDIPSEGASDREVRIAYFKRGREVLAEANVRGIESTASSSVADVPMATRIRFQAVSMAYDIITNPVWREEYLKEGLGGRGGSDVFSEEEEDAQSFAATATTGTTTTSSKPAVRWSEHVEELVFENSVEAAAARELKRKQKKERKQKIVLESAHLNAHLAQLDKEADQHFSTDFLDDLEKSLDGLLNFGGSKESKTKPPVHVPKQAPQHVLKKAPQQQQQQQKEENTIAERKTQLQRKISILDVVESEDTRSVNTDATPFDEQDDDGDDTDSPEDVALKLLQVLKKKSPCNDASKLSGVGNSDQSNLHRDEISRREDEEESTKSSKDNAKYLPAHLSTSYDKIKMCPPTPPHVLHTKEQLIPSLPSAVSTESSTESTDDIFDGLEDIPVTNNSDKPEDIMVPAKERSGSPYDGGSAVSELSESDIAVPKHDKAGPYLVNIDEESKDSRSTRNTSSSVRSETGDFVEVMVEECDTFSCEVEQFTSALGFTDKSSVEKKSATSELDGVVVEDECDGFACEVEQFTSALGFSDKRSVEKKSATSELDEVVVEECDRFSCEVERFTSALGFTDKSSVEKSATSELDGFMEYLVAYITNYCEETKEEMLSNFIIEDEDMDSMLAILQNEVKKAPPITSIEISKSFSMVSSS